MSTLRHGRIVDEAGLAEAAREAIERSAEARTLTAAARHLGKSVSSVSDAVNNPARPMSALRRELVETFSDYEVEGPLYRLVRKAPDPSS